MTLHYFTFKAGQWADQWAGQRAGQGSGQWAGPWGGQWWENQGRWTVPKKKVEKPQDGRHKSGQNIGNPYQMEDNKAAPSAPPPWVFCCLPFGKDFLGLALISGAYPEAFPHFFWDCPPSLAFPNDENDASDDNDAFFNRRVAMGCQTTDP